MSASKTLTAAIAAATIVGTVGFVSAQTSGTDQPSSATPGATSSEQMNQSPSPAPASPSTTPDTSATPTTPSTTTPDTSATPPASGDATAAEPAPKADRN